MSETSAPQRICIVDDDADTRALIRRELESANYSIDECANGNDFLQKSERGSFDVLILDVGLPDVDGFEICRRIRSAGSEVPIIFVTSRAEEIDRVSGFALGADDYVSKPFSAKELTFRVKAMLRRFSGSAPRSAAANPTSNEMRFGPLAIDPEKRRVMLGEKLVALTALEFDVLLFLAENPGRPFTRDELMECVWGMKSSQYAPTVTTLLNRLRRKLEPDVNKPVFILTVFGVGYRFVDPAVDEIAI